MSIYECQPNDAGNKNFILKVENRKKKKYLTIYMLLELMSLITKNDIKINR